MPSVWIDGVEVALPPGRLLNGIEAARLAGAEIPHYCWHPGLSVVASCRMCLVESGTRNAQTGEIVMVPKLVPACQTPAKDGTVFVTNSPKVHQSRAQVEEYLLIHHPIDCPICDKAGECLLQDYHFEHGQKERRADIKPFTSRRRDVGPTVTLFVDRCVACSRCVRFTREVSGTAELMFVHRGAHEEIDVVPGYPLENKLAGNVVDLCPVGALGDKDFLYNQRVWFMKSHPQVCPHCSTGCSILTQENQDRVYRIKPRENAEVNRWWICDDGRYGYHHVHREDRLLAPRRRVSGQWQPLDWARLGETLGETIARAGRLGVAISPMFTCEEAYLLAKTARAFDPEAVLAVGFVPIEGEDQAFPGGFTIRAEKCPNRRGVEAIVRHFGGLAGGWEEFSAEAANGAIAAAWVTAAYPRRWIDEAGAARLAGAKTLIVQDLFASPLWEQAEIQLPSAAFAERVGSYVNQADHWQWSDWAVRPPSGVRLEGSLFWQLAGYRGLYQPKTILAEMAAEVPYFAAAVEAPSSSRGVTLAQPNLQPTA